MKEYEDEERVWNDAHLRFCFYWLVGNQQSPFYRGRLMLMAALNIRKEKRLDWIRKFRDKRPMAIYYKTRVVLTARFKEILAGVYVPKVLKRGSDGRILKFEIEVSLDPKPLNCPPFYVGRINLGQNGPKVTFRRTDVIMVPRHNPEGMARLLNPFGRR